MDGLKRFFETDDGASGVEYGIMVAGVAALIISVAFSMGAKVPQGFNDLLALWP